VLRKLRGRRTAHADRPGASALPGPAARDGIMTGSTKADPTAPGVAGRPLSPHLSVYRLPLLALMSISHRVTGAALVAGQLLLAWWVIAAASGEEAYAAAAGFIGSPLGLLMLFGWTAAFWYHLLNGVRHLVWDSGHALDLKSSYTGGYAVLIGTATLTVFSWIAGLVVWF